MGAHLYLAVDQRQSESTPSQRRMYEKYQGLDRVSLQRIHGPKQLGEVYLKHNRSIDPQKHHLYGSQHQKWILVGNLVLCGSGNHSVCTLANFEASQLTWLSDEGKRDWWRRVQTMMPGLRSQASGSVSPPADDHLSV